MKLCVREKRILCVMAFENISVMMMFGLFVTDSVCEMQR